MGVLLCSKEDILIFNIYNRLRVEPAAGRRSLNSESRASRNREQSNDDLILVYLVYLIRFNRDDNKSRRWLKAGKF